MRGRHVAVAVAIAAAAVGGLVRAGTAVANYPGTLSGVGTASVDGAIGPGEWDRAATVDFSAALPQAEGGGSVPARAFVMNDAANMYLAVRVARPSYGFGAEMLWFFDRGNQGVRQNGDDTLYAQIWRTSGLLFYDGYRWQCPGAPAGAPAFCGAAYDTVQVAGAPPPGTIDGSAAVREGSGQVVFEISHPLDSADDAHDFSLGPGSTIGYSVSVRFVAPCQTEPGCWADAAPPDGHIGIAPGAELGITARASPARIRRGKSLTYRIVVVAAPTGATARDVLLEAQLPRTVRVTSAQTTAGQSCDRSAGVSCELGTLAPGSQAVVTIRARAVRVGNASLTSQIQTSSFEASTSRSTATAKATVIRR